MAGSGSGGVDLSIMGGGRREERIPGEMQKNRSLRVLLNTISVSLMHTLLGVRLL